MKLSTKIFAFSFFILIFCQNIDQVNALRCAHSCSIGPIALGSSNPIKNPCNTIDINITTTFCSVFLTINYETSYIHGTLHEKSRLVNKLSILDLSSIMLPSKTITFINYYCATTDDCDQEFIRETISSSKWFQLNETKVRTDITSLLFKTNSSTENIICDNNSICPWNENCYAQFIQNSSILQINQIDFNNKYPCNNISSSQVNIKQSFSTPGDNQDLMIEIYCNKNRCNQQKIVEQVYNIFRNDFNLPFNYSAFISKPNRSHRIEHFISIPVFLFFISIYI
ncbi:unnamed protein product [Rotaria sordida]|uniref:Uncharacterized protein n=1 Tax=Rotaria sordida TaxID=392033 RepID=A0A819E7Q9_9BILA|nr:unnamed protein product [Rotaria sordida]